MGGAQMNYEVWDRVSTNTAIVVQSLSSAHIPGELSTQASKPTGGLFYFYFLEGRADTAVIPPLHLNILQT